MIELVIVFIIAFFLGIVAGINFHKKAIIALIEKELNNELKKQIKEQEVDIVEVVIEKHDGVFFVYNQKDSKYIAHGSTFDELEKSLKQNHPNTKFFANKESFSLLTGEKDVSI